MAKKVVRLTTHQIIDETVAYYEKNIRARNDIWCEYLTDDGRMCAVGRCLTPRSLQIAQTEFEGKDFGSLNLNRIKFKAQYTGKCDDFWLELQSLHDSEKYWNGNHLTDMGEIKVKALKERFVNI